MADPIYGPPAPPPWRSPEGKRARAEMLTAREKSPEQHSAAARFLRAVLGPQTAPEAENWLERFERRLWGWPLREPPYQKKYGPLNIAENLDPRILGIYDLAARSYPEAARDVYGLYELPEGHGGDTLGEYTTLGGLGVKGRYRGQPRSQSDLMSTMLHEFGHARGIEDRYADRDLITTYDIGRASNLLRGDVNLPYEGPPIVTGRERPKKATR